MATVIADMSMSLDGFVADSEDRTDLVFGWFFGGDTPVPTANPHVTFQVSEASARELREGLASVGALISGRRTFDLAGGWGGAHPMGVPVVVMTHDAPDGYEDAPFHFVSDGIESAVAKANVKHLVLSTLPPIEKATNGALRSPRIVSASARNEKAKGDLSSTCSGKRETGVMLVDMGSKTP